MLNSLEFSFVAFIEQKNVSFNLIKEKYLENKILLNKLTEELMTIEPTTSYSGQTQDEVYKSYEKRLQLEEHFKAIFSTGNGNCCYNSLSYLLFGNEQFWFIIKICSVFMLFENELYFVQIMCVVLFIFGWNIIFSNFHLRIIFYAITYKRQNRAITLNN